MLPKTFCVALVACFVAAGCASRGDTDPALAATLAFAKPGTSTGFPGSFRTLDGRDIPGTPATLTLPPGRHKIGYWCPDHIVMDGPPTVSARFEAGRAYVLHCQGNEDGRVEALPAPGV